MQWSAHIHTQRFVATQLRILPLIVHIYYVLLATIFGFAWGGTSPTGWLIRAVIFYVLLWALFCGLSVRRYRRMIRLTGTDETRYEMTDDTISVHAGKDTVSLPRDQLVIRKSGPLYIILKRQRTRLGSLVLQFDDEPTKQRALEFFNDTKQATV